MVVYAEYALDKGDSLSNRCPNAVHKLVVHGDERMHCARKVDS